MSGSQGLAIHHLLWLQRWGEAVACRERSRDEEHLGDVFGALKYLREATREDRDTGEYLWFLLDLHFLASWLSYTAGKSLGQRNTVGREAVPPSHLEEQGGPVWRATTVHPSWIYDLPLQKPWNNPAQRQEKWPSSPHAQQNPSPTVPSWPGEAVSRACGNHCYSFFASLYVRLSTPACPTRVQSLTYATK